MPVDRYGALLRRLFAARRFGIVLGLERIRALLDRLGAPDRRLGTVVHVGGTNGKGSTIAILAALARECGLRVATYTSPHLSSLRERIAIDGEMIGEDAIVAAAEAVHAAGGDELTFFEQLTAIGCRAIAQAGVDLTVLEVGLGGRLDATTAVPAPLALVTGVALDHQAILGDTIAAIAAEKAGIFKPGQRVVIGASGERVAVPLLAAAARAAGAASVAIVEDAAVVRVPAVGLPGAHQRRNAALALAALDELEVLGIVHGDEPKRARALATVRHPGRYEVIAGSPAMILDGAHNPHGAAALGEALRERGERPVLVVAISADKDVRGIAAALAPHVSAVIATRYRQERAMDPDALAAVFRELTSVPVESAPDLETAVAAARRRQTTILIAGTLFLVGEARVRYLGAIADPQWVSDPAAASSGPPAPS